MAHFAEIDSNNKVVRVLVVSNEDSSNGQEFLANTLGLGGKWVQTSYNTRGGVHYGDDGKPDNGVALRGNYAGVGYTYDADKDAFYAPQPFASWNLNTSTFTWEAPVAMPTDGKSYSWNEDKKSWDLISTPNA